MPTAAPTFSTTPSGSQSIWIITRVLFVVQAVEGDHAGVLGLAAGAGPGDALLGVLLGDLGVELALDAPDLGHPVGVRVVELRDALDPAHELGEGLELRPLVVGDPDRDVDVDGLPARWPTFAPLLGGCAWTGPTRASSRPCRVRCSGLARPDPPGRVISSTSRSVRGRPRSLSTSRSMPSTSRDSRGYVAGWWTGPARRRRGAPTARRCRRPARRRPGPSEAPARPDLDARIVAQPPDLAAAGRGQDDERPAVTSHPDRGRDGRAGAPEGGE